jgi:hypothetical protein
MNKESMDKLILILKIHIIELYIQKYINQYPVPNCPKQYFSC